MHKNSAVSKAGTTSTTTKSKTTPKKSKKLTPTSSKRSITTTARHRLGQLNHEGGSFNAFMQGEIAVTRRNILDLQLLTIANQGMKYVAYNDGVEITNIPKVQKPTPAPTPTSSPTTPTAQHSQSKSSFSFSNVDLNQNQYQGHQKQQPQYEAYPTPKSPRSHSHHAPPPHQPRPPPTKPIEGNPLYAPMDVPVQSLQVRNSPLVRHLDVNKLLFQTTNFLFIGPRDAHVESVAYLYAQQHESIQVKYVNHKTLSSTLEDIVMNGKETILWSDIPDIVNNTELSQILPSPNFVTVYLDFPSNKAKFASTQTRDVMVRQELVDTGLLPPNHPIATRYQPNRPDGSSPITSNSALEHKSLWQFDGSFDYRILLTDSMTPNEIFDRIQARMATSDAYITTRLEFTSESNALTQERVHERQMRESMGIFDAPDPVLGQPEKIGGIRRVGDAGEQQREAERKAKLKAQKKAAQADRKILRYLPDGRVLYDDGEVGFPGQDNIEGDGKEHGLFELNSFLNTIVSPVAGQGGLFLPDMPSPYLLNQSHMFDIDEDGKAERYDEEMAEFVVNRGQTALDDRDGPGGSDTRSKKSKVHNLEVVNDNHDNGSEDDDLDPAFTGTVNQMHLFPQSLRRMCELTYLQRLQRILEGFPFAGIRPEHLSEGLMQHFFDFNNDNIITTSSLHHLKPRKSKHSHKMIDEQGNLDLKAPVPKVTLHPQSLQPTSLPPFNPRPTSFVELYHSDQGLYEDIKIKVTSALMAGAEQFESAMKDKNIQQQRTMYFFQHNKLPLDEATELIHPPSLYDRFAMISSGTPEFTLASLRQQSTLTPHLILLPIKQKGIIVPQNDSTKSTTHLHRGLLSTAWSPLQYLQFHTNLQLKDNRIVPIGSTYYESRSLQELSHIKVKSQFQLYLEDAMPISPENPATLLRPGEHDHLRLINMGTMSPATFSTLIPDMSIFLQGYLELVNQGTIMIPTDRSSSELSEQIKSAMGLNTLHGGLNKNEDGDFLGVNKYISRLAPRIYPQYSPQRLSQWDHQIIAPIKPNLSPREITPDNIASFFKPTVCDVIVPVTDLNMLPSAVMSRDMGAPIRQFIIAVDDKYRWLVPLLTKGLIPGVDKSRKSDVWHLRRDDITALERFFYLVCGRDSDLVPTIIQALEVHYTASLYVHDPNRTNYAHKKKAALKKEAQIALGTDAVPNIPSKRRRNRYTKQDAGDGENMDGGADDGVEVVQQSQKPSHRQLVNQYMKQHFGATPSQGIVIDVGDNSYLNNNDEKIGNDATVNDKKRAFFQQQLRIVEKKPLLNPVKATSTPEYVAEEYKQSLEANPNVILPESERGQKPLKAHQIKATKKRRKDDDDDDDDDDDLSEDSSGGDTQPSEMESENELRDDDDALGQESGDKITEDMIVELMLEDPDVGPAVKKVIEKMLRQMTNHQALTPTNHELTIFQEAFAKKQDEYQDIMKSMPSAALTTGSKKKVAKPSDDLETQDMVLQRIREQAGDGEFDDGNGNSDDDDDDNDDDTDDDIEIDPELQAKMDEDEEWENTMIHETYDLQLPDEIVRALQEEFVVTHVPKKFLYQTIQNSLSEHGRLLDRSSALALAASTINPTVQDNSMINLDEFFDEIIEHCKDLRGDADSNPNRHMQRLKHDANSPTSRQLAQLEKKMQALNRKISHNPDDGELISQAVELVKQIEDLQQIALLSPQGDDKPISEKRTKYPKIPIPLVIPALAHPFHDYELLIDALGIQTEHPSMKLSNKDLSLHVLKQLQSIYGHAVKLGKENGFELDTANPANIANRTKDLILPPPHQGTLQMLAAVQQQQYAEKPVRMHFVDPNQEHNQFTQFDFVLNDQLLRFMKMKHGQNVPATIDTQ